jgi:hypothetical protein
MAGLTMRATFIFRAANSKAESTLAATARTLRRKIRFRDIDLVSLISLILGPSIAPPHSEGTSFFSGSECKATARRAIASSARSGRNKCGNPVCQLLPRSVDCPSNPRSLARKTAFVLCLQSNLQFTECGHQPLAKDVERIRLSAIGHQ